MATIRSELQTRAPAGDVWAAIRDVGALHTRLAPCFVVDTKLEPGARVVTFANGVTLREPIVTLDDEARRLVWTPPRAGAPAITTPRCRSSPCPTAAPPSSGPSTISPTRSARICRRRSKRELRR